MLTRSEKKQEGGENSRRGMNTEAHSFSDNDLMVLEHFRDQLILKGSTHEEHNLN